MRPNSRIPVSPEDASNITAALPIGQVIAPFVCLFVVDRIGKQKSLLATAVPMAITWAMILAAENVTVLVIARIVAGFSQGLVISILPMYTGEVLSSNLRGSLSTINAITFAVGILFMFAAGPHLGIRWMAGICLTISIIFLICFWFAPESPYFLMMKGREDEAEAALEKLRGRTDVAEELELIKATLREKGTTLGESNKAGAEERRNPLKQLFRVRGNLKALLLGMVLTTMQHLCGLASVLNFCHVILEAIGSGIDVYWATITFCILQILSGVITVVVIDKAGRRPLLFTSASITILLLGIIASYFFMMEHMHMNVKPFGIIPLCAIFLLIMALSLGVMTIPSIVTSEIFATEVKVLGGSIVWIFGGLTGILCSKTYLIMVTPWGLGHSFPFFGYAMSTLLCSIILLRWLPETKGKTLLKIQQELNA